jgi:hypothetical protein
MGTDWVAWHEAAYGPDGPLRRRLEVVRRSVADATSRSRPGEIRIISVCAGDGREVIGGLVGHRRAGDAHVLLVETDPRLAEGARRSAQSAGLLHVEVIEADAGLTTAYESLVPADVVVVSGLFSHLTDGDVRQTIETLPLLCDRNAFVIWTRDRSEPDLTPAIRAWFVGSGFQDLAYSRFVEGDAGVGMARLAAPPRPFQPGVRMFRSLVDQAQSGRSVGSAGVMRSG